MKRFVIILYLYISVLSAFAQTENMPDTIPDFHSLRYKDFGGFLLDMGSLMETHTFMLPPTLNFNPDSDERNLYTLNPDALRFSTDVTYSSGLQLSPYSIYSFLYPGMNQGNIRWQGASYKLKNGLRLNTYGEYDADGNKVKNPSALPWEKNNFNAAFELKSPDGRFGVRFEVKRGRNYPY